MRVRHVVLLLLLVAATPAQADDELRVTKDGFRLKLEDGLSRTPLGGLQITKRDLEGAVGVDVRRLIPRPQNKRVRRKPAPTVWLLCYGDTCVQYRGEVGGTDGYEAFPLDAIAKLFKWQVQTEGNVVEINDRGTPKVKYGGKPGRRAGDVRLKALDGTERSLSALRGKRVLVVVWAPWSASRDTLATWAAEWALRKDKDLELWAVAVDLEGAGRVEAYVPPTIKDRVVLDRDGRIPALLGLRAAGHFALIDDLGLVRATGEKPTSIDLGWIDAHLAETPRAAADDERVASATPDVAAARALVAKKPKNPDYHAALADALEAAGEQDAARAAMTEAFKRSKKPRIYAVRLARMHMDAGNRPAALNVLDEARRKDPKNMWLRRQFWALDAPERFYTGPIDMKWQSEQRRAEDLEWGRRRKR